MARRSELARVGSHDSNQDCGGEVLTAAEAARRSECAAKVDCADGERLRTVPSGGTGDDDDGGSGAAATQLGAEARDQALHGEVARLRQSSAAGRILTPVVVQRYTCASCRADWGSRIAGLRRYYCTKNLNTMFTNSVLLATMCSHPPTRDRATYNCPWANVSPEKYNPTRCNVCP